MRELAQSLDIGVALLLDHMDLESLADPAIRPTPRLPTPSKPVRLGVQVSAPALCCFASSSHCNTNRAGYSCSPCSNRCFMPAFTMPCAVIRCLLTCAVLWLQRGGAVAKRVLRALRRNTKPDETQEASEVGEVVEEDECGEQEST